MLVDKNLTFLTFTAWENQEAMRQYCQSDAHAKAVPRLASWYNESSIAHPSQENPTFPGWDEVHRRMQTEGRASPVENPSTMHIAYQITQPKVINQTEIKPSKNISG